MRKILIFLLLVTLGIGAGWITYKGIDNGTIKINSYLEISEENEKLDKLIDEANTQKTSTYAKKKAAVESAYKNLVTSRESYQELLNMGVDNDGVPLSKIQEYEIEKIWITIGNYAKKEGIDVKLEITSNNSVSGTYDLNFTAVGIYSSIEDFLRDIQGDNTLVFKIENFKLVAGGTNNLNGSDSNENLTATFVCKDIKLNITESNSDDSNSSQDTNTKSTSSTSSTSTATK